MALAYRRRPRNASSLISLMLPFITLEATVQVVMTAYRPFWRLAPSAEERFAIICSQYGFFSQRYEPLAKLSARTREFPSETTTLDSDLVISSDSHRIWRRARSFRSFQASRWRPRPPAYGQGGGAACVMPLRNETYQLQDREAQNSEH